MNCILTTHVTFRNKIISVSELKDNSNIKVQVKCKHKVRWIKWSRREQSCKRCAAEKGVYNTSKKGRKIVWGSKISSTKKGKKLTDEHKKALIEAHLGKKLSKEHVEAQNRGKIKRFCEKNNIKIEDFVDFPTNIDKKMRSKGVRFISEHKVREKFESMFNASFPSCRPDFLKNPETGFNLELDGYCEELKIAFEYDGKQHYREIEYWGGREELEKIQRRDNLKQKLCEDAGVKLIRIPHFVVDVKRYVEHQLSGKKNNLIMLCGQSGAGKSTVADKLTDKFHVISFDNMSQKDIDDEIFCYDGDKTILLDVPIKISTNFKKYRHYMNVSCVFIVESIDTIKQRLSKRGGHVKNVERRFKRIKGLSDNYADFSGTADEVLKYLKQLKS